MACLEALVVLALKGGVALVKGAPILAKGAVVHAPHLIPIAVSYVKTYGMAATMYAVGVIAFGVSVSVGGVLWTVERVAALKALIDALQAKDMQTARQHAIKLLDLLGDEVTGPAYDAVLKPRLERFVGGTGDIENAAKLLLMATRTTLKDIEAERGQ
jgi:hypothetical protein